MSRKNDAGPAFPHLNPNFDGNWDRAPQRGGMSLRDYFAAKALNGILQEGFVPRQFRTSKPTDGSPPPLLDYPAIAYAIADAMIAERDK